ncbi:MerR family transcriptional regulator [Limnobacter litoralis]|uniref:MerR family transcriptional regulator n=1 Tax=Limnobacter litoralis TaxID=481366 RepID=A0ABQ5YTG8_9BURK|nr:MerR family transcriptional regulator [Limnobacter litoralis]GLR26736.1 MerR family transcriptional regulator [Limnobacter litoralis]
MKISDVAKQLGLTPKTIRFYEDQGLITPKRADSGSWFSKGKNRVFRQEDLSRLDFVKKARELDFSIKEIQSILEHYDQGPSCGCGARGKVDELLKRKLKEVRELQHGLKNLEERLLEIRSNNAAIASRFDNAPNEPHGEFLIADYILPLSDGESKND